MIKRKIAAAVGILAVMFASTAFAGEWRDDEGNQFYVLNNGQQLAEGWNWIDQDGDGNLERYYFDENKYLVKNTTTLDGHQVNENGAWVKDGVVQTKAMNAVAPITDEDFVVSGNNDIVNEVEDHNAFTYLKKVIPEYNPESSYYVSFTPSDDEFSVVTFRGITIGNTKDEVEEKYSGTDGNINNNIMYKMAIEFYVRDPVYKSFSQEMKDKIAYSAYYYANQRDLIFYFDSENQVCAIAYWGKL